MRLPPFRACEIVDKSSRRQLYKRNEAVGESSSIQHIVDWLNTHP
jgi:hypothetical protein